MKLYEREEVENTIHELGLTTSVEQLLALFESARLVYLTPEIWKDIQNTDFDVTTPQDAFNRMFLLGKDPYIYDKTVQDIKEGVWYPPLILSMEGQYHLLSGEEQLLVCRVNGISPRVKILEITENMHNEYAKKLRLML